MLCAIQVDIMLNHISAGYVAPYVRIRGRMSEFESTIHARTCLSPRSEQNIIYLKVTEETDVSKRYRVEAGKD